MNNLRGDGKNGNGLKMIQLSANSIPMLQCNSFPSGRHFFLSKADSDCPKLERMSVSQCLPVHGHFGHIEWSLLPGKDRHPISADPISFDSIIKSNLWLLQLRPPLDVV